MINTTTQSNYIKSLYFISSLIIFMFFATGMGMLVKGFHSLPLLISIVFILMMFYLIQTNNLKIKQDDFIFITTLAIFFISFYLLDLLHSESIYSQHIKFFAAAIVAYTLIKLPIKVQVLWAGSAIGAIATATYAILDVFVFGSSRADINGFNAIYFGAGAISLSYILLAGIVWASKLENYKVFWVSLLSIGAISGLVATLLSGSRGVWISVIPISLVLFVAYSRFFNISFKKILLLLIVLIFISGLLVWITGTYSILSDRTSKAVNEIEMYSSDIKVDTSIGYRFEMWKTSFLAFKKSPVFGLGQKKYYEHQKQLIDEGVVTPQIAKFKTAHSGYLDVLGKSGLVGLFVFVIFHLVLLYLFFKKIRIKDPLIQSLSLAGVIIIVSYLVFNLTDIYLFRSKNISLFVFPLVFIWAFISNREQEIQSNA